MTDGDPAVEEAPGGMVQINLEIMPMLAPLFGASDAQRLTLTRTARDGETVGEFLNNLVRDFRGAQGYVFDAVNRKPTGHVSLVLNGVLLEFANGVETPLKQGDSILFLPAFAGG